MRNDSVSSHGVHLKPRQQPESVGELAPSLTRPFRVEEGKVQLAGCLFEDVPFCMVNDVKGQARVFDWDGREIVDTTLLAWLSESLVPLERLPPRAFKLDWSAWLAKLTSTELASEGKSKPTFIWARWAEGKIALSSGKATVYVPFGLWAQPVMTQRTRVPVYVCPLTGVASDDLVPTDDGELAPRESVETCTVSGRKRLRQRLVRCGATQAWASPEYLVECPVSGDRVVATSLVRCRDCRSLVAPRVVRQRVCELCRSLVPIETLASLHDWLVRSVPDNATMSWKGAASNRQAVIVGKRWWRGRRLVLELPEYRVIRSLEADWLGRWQLLASTEVPRDRAAS